MPIYDLNKKSELTRSRYKSENNLNIDWSGCMTFRLSRKYGYRLHAAGSMKASGPVHSRCDHSSDMNKWTMAGSSGHVVHNLVNGHESCSDSVNKRTVHI